MSAYIPTIGLEIHVQLTTTTKLFSRSLNDPDEKKPNANVSPVDLGHPGTLPVLNKEAVKQVLMVGHALGSTIADYTEWDRKNYFYPDIPKAYQISQYKYPLIQGGELAGVAITRIHLEEDTGRSLHDQGNFSLVDYNRAGMPLMELVTEPVIHSAEQASRFARELQLLLRTLGVATANMEKGEMRVEANISISKTDELGTKVEVKNINSFKAMEKAVAYEIERHTKILEAGETLVQETRGWNDSTQETFSQRSKENAHDYRYFPDPDIPKIWISEIPEFQESVLRDALPELPNETRNRLSNEYNLKSDAIEELTYDIETRNRFQQSADIVSQNLISQDQYSSLANYLLTDLRGLESGSVEGDSTHITPQHLADLSVLVADGTLSSRGVKDILSALYQGETGTAKEIATAKNLIQQNDASALEGIVDQVITDNPTVVTDIQSGKEQLLQFLVGQGMKLSKGSANPQLLAQMLKSKI